MNACTLLVPELGRFLDAVQRVPDADRVFCWAGRARWLGWPSDHRDQRLFQLLAGNAAGHTAPTAAVLAQHSGLEGRRHAWMALSPGRFSAELTRLMVIDRSPMNTAEAIFSHEPLCAALSDTLSEHGLRLEGVGAGQLLISGEVLRSVVESTPLESLRGRDALHRLPRNRGADGVRWSKLFNQLQMLLHDALVGPGERDHMPCNGLWPHGHGSLPAICASADIDGVCSNDPIAVACSEVLLGRAAEPARDGEKVPEGHWLAVLEYTEQRHAETYWREITERWLQPLRQRGFRVALMAERHGGWRLGRRWWPGQRTSLSRHWDRAGGDISAH